MFELDLILLPPWAPSLLRAAAKKIQGCMCMFHLSTTPAAMAQPQEQFLM
jgi:hypothetical protein